MQMYIPHEAPYAEHDDVAYNMKKIFMSVFGYGISKNII